MRNKFTNFACQRLVKQFLYAVTQKHYKENLSQMKKKKQLKNELSNSENFRWTQDDIDARLPERYEKVLSDNGFTFSGCTRGLIRHLVAAVEAQGGILPTVRRAVDATIDDASAPRVYPIIEPRRRIRKHAKK